MLQRSWNTGINWADHRKSCCKQHACQMYSNLVRRHLYRRLLGHHAEKNLQNVSLISNKSHRVQRETKTLKSYTRFTWSTHRKPSVTQLSHVVCTTPLRMTEFALHCGKLSSPAKIKMAQKLASFGQRVVAATPRVATRLSFQALGKLI